MTAYNLPENDPNASGDTDGGLDPGPDPDADPEPLAVSGVVPPWGSNAGGSIVEVQGGPFDSTARVFFQGANFTVEGDVLSASANALQVKVPATNDEGFTDVEVRTQTHEGRGTHVFTYWKDGAGKYSLIGAHEFIEVAGGYWDSVYPDQGWAYAFFAEPTSNDWKRMYMADRLDNCMSNYDVDAKFASIELLKPGVPALTLSGTGAPLSLLQDATADWFYASQTLDENRPEASFDLEAIDSNALPSFPLLDALRTGGDFVLTSPAIYGYDAPLIKRYNFLLSWDATTPGAYAVAQIIRANRNGDVVDDVTCAMADDGSFQVPGSVWTDWDPNGDQLTLYIGRVTESDAVLPFNNTRSGLVGVRWVMGAGWAD
jgi:hypothetical protein